MKESVPGAYVQYTFNLTDQLMLMGGIRGDYSSEHGFFVTPRAHVKYNPNEYLHFRLSLDGSFSLAALTNPVFNSFVIIIFCVS